MIFIVSPDWKFRSLLRAELKERGFQALGMIDLNDIFEFLEENFEPKLILIDSINYNSSDVERIISKIQDVSFLLTNDSLKGKFDNLFFIKRPFTVEECLKFIQKCVAQK